MPNITVKTQPSMYSLVIIEYQISGHVFGMRFDWSDYFSSSVSQA